MIVVYVYAQLVNHGVNLKTHVLLSQHVVLVTMDVEIVLDLLPDSHGALLPTLVPQSQHNAQLITIIVVTAHVPHLDTVGVQPLTHV